jgi:hypothetical protein
MRDELHAKVAAIEELARRADAGEQQRADAAAELQRLREQSEDAAQRLSADVEGLQASAIRAR